ncbi:MULTISPECIES: MurR/RpiR family transcriptional regulator [unclassified Clostridium]|uniref:MurR/RpiR family transcriptional regulator n=1 Tax=unclassified Clostridium TaxID=2614128 RepID=UPI000297FEA0|nr:MULTISPECIES: MurR/RpiR family transcriptional regulator [unclassified Clostridium]EKQ51634.1 MAG: transcriptional regulator [Clostridium sp. Maddingley MBC34-26]
MKNSCLLQINDRYDSFSSKERIIADFILKNPAKVVYYTIEDFATELSISDATVFRFIKKLGYSGYQYFKVALASEVTKTSNENKIRKDDINSSSNPYKYLTELYSNNIQENSDKIDTSLLDRIVKTMMNSKRIAFLGLGSSGELALNAYNKFIDTGLFCIYNMDYHMQLKITSQLSSDDLAIVFSNSGMNKDIITLVDTLKEQSVPTIGLSSNPNSPFAKMVNDFIYTYPTNPKTVIEKLSSYISQVTIIDYLYLKILANGKHIDVNLMKPNKTIQSRKYTFEEESK